MQRKKEKNTSHYSIKGLPKQTGLYQVCLLNKETGKHEWKPLHFSPGEYDPTWEKVICWSFT